MTTTQPSPASVAERAAVVTTDTAAEPASDQASDQASETVLVEEDLLVEDVSIDGMCGVY